MWILTPLQPGEKTHYLQCSKEYVVGRKNCDILLPNDQSISRAHAHLNATDQTLTLKDTSKYGTFVNDERVRENTTVNLTSGSSIRFGVFHSKFIVEYLQPVVCSSCLDNGQKASLSEALLHIGGKVVNTWTEDCTHLVMSTVKVTIKTISALMCCCPIVKPEFFTALHAAIQAKSPPPKAERFLPEMGEPSLHNKEVNLGVISKRKALFTGKTFVFLSAKQFKRLSAAVSFGSGTCKLLKEGSLPQDLLESAQNCVVDVTTGSSQTVLSSSIEWVNSVKNIVEKKGLRVITELEIGLAAIYASCEKYCNSSSLMDSDIVPKVTSRIPSASLSQSSAVEETVLREPSLNITAYAVNTEPSEGLDINKVSLVTAVGETPQKRQNTKDSVPALGTEKKLDTQSFVAETLNSSFNIVEHTESNRTLEECKLTGGESSGIQSLPSFTKPTCDTKTFLQKQLPQKSRPFAQGSPQKQSSLTSFFQPITKKRPLEDDISEETSKPKRVTQNSSTRIQLPVMCKEMHTEKGTADSFKPSMGLADAQNKAHGQKRKEMEKEIELEELESIMSEDMDFFDESPSRSQSQTNLNSSNQQNQVYKAEASSKRQRLQLQDAGDSKQTQQSDLDKPSTSSKNSEVKFTEQNVCINIPIIQHAENKSSKPSTKSSANKKQHELPFMDRGFVEDFDLLKTEMMEVSLKPVITKQEKSKVEDDLPKTLLLVDFRDLKVTEPPKRFPQQKKNNSFTKNFKCFHKVQMLGAAHVIRGTDLLAHNRGKNSDLDDWLKDAAEEELQSRRDENAGDDLFRYNPSKLTKRR